MVPRRLPWVLLRLLCPDAAIPAPSYCRAPATLHNSRPCTLYDHTSWPCEIPGLGRSARLQLLQRVHRGRQAGAGGGRAARVQPQDVVAARGAICAGAQAQWGSAKPRTPCDSTRDREV